MLEDLPGGEPGNAFRRLVRGARREHSDRYVLPGAGVPEVHGDVEPGPVRLPVPIGRAALGVDPHLVDPGLRLQGVNHLHQRGCGLGTGGGRIRDQRRQGLERGPARHRGRRADLHGGETHLEFLQERPLVAGMRVVRLGHTGALRGRLRHLGPRLLPVCAQRVQRPEPADDDDQQRDPPGEPGWHRPGADGHDRREHPPYQAVRARDEGRAEVGGRAPAMRQPHPGDRDHGGEKRDQHGRSQRPPREPVRQHTEDGEHQHEPSPPIKAALIADPVRLLQCGDY